MALSLLVGLVGLVGLGAAPAGAAFPGENGRIVFERLVASASADIYSMDSDGSVQINLTPSPSDGYSVDPDFSPDGTRIVFSSNRDGGGDQYDIYVMNADGSGVVRLTDDAAPDNAPSFSPDGTRIAFTSRRSDNNLNIYVMNADGSGQTRLTSSFAFDWQPAFSPDGEQIAFSSGRDANPELYVMNADGSAQTRLTYNPPDPGLPCYSGHDFDPNFSPDGEQIAFSSSRADCYYEIFVINADGSGIRQLTRDHVGAIYPAFSPDGKQLAFMRFSNGNWEIYTMAGDGSGQTNLTNTPGATPAAIDEWTPAWAPTPASAPSPPADVRVSELALRGAGGAGDDFVELTNRDGVARAIGGWTLEACDPQGVPSTVATVPADTTLGPGQSYLFNGQGFGATADQELPSDLPDSGQAGVRLRLGTSGVAIDAVGSGSSPCREGAGLSFPGADANFSFVRKTASNQLTDTGDNAADFDFVSPTAGVFSGVQSKLGVVGSEALGDPRRLTVGFRPGLFDPSQSASGSNNRGFSTVGFGGQRGTEGVLRVRRSFTNTGSEAVSDLRLRVHRLTTEQNRAAGQADLRLIDATAETLTVAGSPRTARATDFESEAQCPTGPTAEDRRCGGLNARATVSLSGDAVDPGETVYFNLDFAIEQSGAFSLFLVPEVAP